MQHYIVCKTLMIVLRERRNVSTDRGEEVSPERGGEAVWISFLSGLHLFVHCTFSTANYVAVSSSIANNSDHFLSVPTTFKLLVHALSSLTFCRPPLLLIPGFSYLLLSLGYTDT